MEKATFAAGCFWGIEHKFSQVEGVLETSVGYCGGKTENPTYEEVCSDETGHAECVQLFFDPNKISYEQLVEVFWKIHNPTTKNRQGFDVGSQYRSVIFYHSEEQKRIAELSREKLQNSGKLPDKIVTEIVPAQEFYKAEEYHQKYYRKHGGSCGI
jgi:peptide-methionine (S)-S-oxide reductase